MSNFQKVSQMLNVIYRLFTQNFSRTGKYGNISAILKPIFRKFTINQKVFPDIYCVKFYPNSMSNIKHKGKISFASLNKLQLSSYDSHRTCNNSAPLHGDFYTGFHPNWSRNVENTGKNSLMHLNKSDCQ